MARIMNTFKTREEGGWVRGWIPACAGMTVVRAGMTVLSAGMTAYLLSSSRRRGSISGYLVLPPGQTALAPAGKVVALALGVGVAFEAFEYVVGLQSQLGGALGCGY